MCGGVLLFFFFKDENIMDTEMFSPQTKLVVIFMMWP